MATFHTSRRERTARGRLWLLPLLALLGADPAFAQGSRTFTDALYALTRSEDGQLTLIRGRLFGGRIDSQIDQNDGNHDTFAEGDRIRFVLSPTRGDRQPVACEGSPAEFETCLRSRASDVLAILFPAGLSAGMGGVDVGQFQAQQMLVTTALATTVSSEAGRLRRSEVGGLLEAEWFTDDRGLTGQAWQGFYRIGGGPVSLRGRYAELRQEEGVRTRAVLASIAVHPSFQLNEAAQWRAGIDLRSGLLYSQSAAIDLGTLDMGAGLWSSFAKDFSRVRLGAGGALQASRNHVPTMFLSDNLDYIADAINDIGIAYDVAYGGVFGVLLSKRSSFNAKVLETRALNAEGVRPITHVMLGSLSYLIGGHTPVDVGYKYSTGGGLVAHSLFVQGNYRW